MSGLVGKVISWTAGDDDPRHYRIIWAVDHPAGATPVKVAAIREINGALQGGSLSRLRIFHVEIARNGATTAVSNYEAARTDTPDLTAIRDALDAFKGGETDTAIAEEMAWYATVELDAR